MAQRHNVTNSSAWPLLTLVTQLSEPFWPLSSCVTVDIIYSLRWEDKVALHGHLLSQDAKPPDTCASLIWPSPSSLALALGLQQAHGWWVSIAQPADGWALHYRSQRHRLSCSHHLANDVRVIVSQLGKMAIKHKTATHGCCWKERQIWQGHAQSSPIQVDAVFCYYGMIEL